jgi:signal transduction histidine kinase
VLERSRLGRLTASRWSDPGLAAGLTAICFVEMAARPEVASSPLAFVFMALLAAPVAARRTHPVHAALAAAATLVAASGLQGDFPPSIAFIIPAVLAYSCGAHAVGRAGAAGVGVLVVAMQVAIGFSEFPNVEIAFGTLPPWWGGRELRKRRALVAELAERNRELEAQQDSFARLAVTRERARIACELHDIVAHHLAVIVVQAGAGRMAAPTRIDDGGERIRGERFRGIRNSGELALADMARLVDVLHADSGNAGRPDRLRLLLEQASAGGIDLRVTPLPRDAVLPAQVEDAAYRIVQEGLTNAMKHAPGSEVRVRLTASGDGLQIEVTDSGESPSSTLAASGSGVGLAGMRERVAALGGDLHAGPDSGGWTLHARLPLTQVIPAG